ncbi:molybdate ABC transporter permease subunit [Granulicella sp. 5B5]|nr:molybdate ABC transporter permease subunit [Granulicella sp. 5B5]QMV20129.1 molybdate ABC transporter permease subunit [Granulicella sp. 5B5]
MDTSALWLTLRLAGLTTLCLLVLATPLALWIASRKSVLRQVVQAAVALPLVLPPTVLGYYLLVGMGPATGVGRLLVRVIGHPLAFTFGGLLVGSILYSLPFAVQPLVVGFAGVDRGVVETARVLGASPWVLFRRVLLPLAKSSFVTAAVLTFAHTLGEFGVVLMIGGDIPGVTRTLSISIYDLVEDMKYGAASRTALALVALSFVALLVLYGRSARRGQEIG